MIVTKPKIDTKVVTDAYETVVYIEANYLQLVMTVKNGVFHTESYPNTVNLLQQNIPEIFDTNCFNEDGLSFYEEVKDTEIAHLLEHLILTNLKASQNDSGLKNCGTYKGYTEWDWNLKGPGVYEICIEGNFLNVETAFEAVTKALEILDDLISTNSDINTDVGTAFAAPTYTIAI